jgi:hypothetical protein
LRAVIRSLKRLGAKIRNERSNGFSSQKHSTERKPDEK